jgi:ankyrin repeat protein
LCDDRELSFQISSSCSRNETGKYVDDYGKNKRDDHHRETSLHYAARHGHEGVVSLLLAHGANPLAVGAHGDASEVHTP